MCLTSSLGRISENGCLECPYHNWQFDREGACTQVILNNPAEIKLSHLSAVGLPTRGIAIEVECDITTRCPHLERYITGM